MAKYVWDTIREQEFCEEIYNAYKKALEERRKDLEEAKNKKQKLKDEVAEKYVMWKIALDIDKNSKIKQKDCYSDLNETLNEYEEYCSVPSNIEKEARLQSEIEWLEREMNKR